MSAAEKFTSADLALMPDDGKRYEIIEGELYVSRQPSAEHQFTCGQLFRFLQEWNEHSGPGAAFPAPGLIFADDDDVAPDVIWISHERLTNALDQAGQLHTAPELVIEVLSPGKANEMKTSTGRPSSSSTRAAASESIGSSIGCSGSSRSTAVSKPR